MKIAVGGFQHETNSFAPAPASYERFVEAGGWPGLTRGEALFDAVGGMNLALAGFIAAAGRRHLLVPLLWANAQPSGPVTSEAFERVIAMMIDDLAATGPVDGVFLDLHGAMVSDDFPDGEGEILRRVRAVVGPNTPIVASLDLHANVTAAMLERADALTAYRTYPHIDMAETGARAAVLLDRLLGSRGAGRGRALRKLDFLIPITAQCSLVEPTRGLYQTLSRIEEETGAWLSFTPGFPPADFADCGPAVFAYAADQATADRAADALLSAVQGAEGAFAEERIWPAAEGAREAVRLAAGATRPVILADTQDNPGAGGSSDTTGIITALAEAGAEGAIVASVHDAEAATAAHRAGLGAKIELSLGGRSGVEGRGPFHSRFIVEALGDGRFDGTGPMFDGAKMDLGPMALLRLADAPGIAVIVATRRQQPATRAIFHHLGVDPAAQRILALKSSVHFRADFEPLAHAVLVVASPGANLADPADFPYTRLGSTIRRRPTPTR